MMEGMYDDEVPLPRRAFGWVERNQQVHPCPPSPAAPASWQRAGDAQYQGAPNFAGGDGEKYGDMDVVICP